MGRFIVCLRHTDKLSLRIACSFTHSWGNSLFFKFLFHELPTARFVFFLRSFAIHKLHAIQCNIMSHDSSSLSLLPTTRFCSESFKNAQVLKSHQETQHADKRKFPCDVCGARYFEKRFLLLHSMQAHHISSPLECDRCNPATEDQKQYMCLNCGKRY